MNAYRISKCQSRVIFLLGILLFLFPAAVMAEQSRVTLSDGSVIQAEVISMARGVYTLRSNTLGTFTLPSSKVRSITQGGGGGVPQFQTNSGNRGYQQNQRSYNNRGSQQNQRSSNNLQGLSQPQGGQVNAQQLDQLKNQLMSDPQTMQMIQNLQKDQNVQNILNDKNLMNSINQQDLGAVSRDPKMQQLMNSQEFQQILKNAR